MIKLSRLKLEEIYKKIINWKPVFLIIKYSKQLVLPGFDGVPFYDVFLFFIKGMQKGAITQRAASLSFNFFLALFPAIIFLFTLIPYLPIHNFQTTLFEILQSFLPSNAFETVKSTISDIITNKRSGLLSIGFIMTLYFATNGVNAIIEAFNKTYHTVESRSWIRQRLISIVLVLILSLLLIVSISLITIGSFVLDYLVHHGILKGQFTIYLLFASRWIVLLAMLFFGVSFLYYFAPAKKRTFRFISAGSTLATALTLISILGFNYYVANFSKYNALYGSIGTLIVILMWIYFNAIILLLGFELNASISHAKKHGKKIIIL
ncbi:MAG: YihY/virulence factor BrkB family protein [Bacteroidetes bacterium]|nr:YihY/virulence factor BrkB family protein [Bacteroidota bacterium]